MGTLSPDSIFTPHKLIPFLDAHQAAEVVTVAFSGGVDSSVLLHALSRLRDDGRLSVALEAIHVNHGLQLEAEQWGIHCQQFCAHLGVPLHLISVDATPQPGRSPEESAREARYRAFRDQLMEGDQLVTAHHLDDQAETFLLQALRGAGPRGLSAMSPVMGLGQGWLLRPLLTFSRRSLLEYARVEKLEWVEDPTNRQLSADRNYIRHQIMPALKERWPAASSTLSRSASHCAEASSLLDGWAREQLIDIAPGEPLPLLEGEPVESSKMRVRHWLEHSGAGVPDTVHLQRIVDEMVRGREDATPLVHWSNRDGDEVRVRRFRGSLYLEIGGDNKMDSPYSVEWDLCSPLRLPGMGMQLVAREVAGRGINRELVDGRTITIRSRRGGERCRLPGAKQSRTLKNLLREDSVPPWKRGMIPLIFIDDELAQVVGHFICDPFLAKDGESGWWIEDIPLEEE